MEIEHRLTSQNDLGGNHKDGYKYRNIRKGYEKALVGLNNVPRANKFRVATVTRFYGKNQKTGRWYGRYDIGNLVGGCKPLIDTLKAYAVILDDREDCFAGYYDQERSPDGVDRIRIEILEYE